MASTRRNASIKFMEKEIVRESKAEGDHVKRELKELSRLEKETRKAQKSAANADSILGKREKYKHKTAKAMNEAIQEHDIAVAKLQAAAGDVKLKHDHRTRLMKALEVKKGIVERAMEHQEEYDKVRETKLAQMRGVRVADLNPNVISEDVKLPGQRGPAVDNDGRAAGYGVDFNHTAVDSEGNAQGTTNYNGGSTTSRNIRGRGYN